MKESDFAKTFKALTQDKIPGLAEKAMGGAMLLLANAANGPLIGKAVPHDKGVLAGSSAVFVQNKKIAHYTPPHSHPEATPPSSTGEGLVIDAIVGVIGYNTPYAARLHENPQFKFREKGTGGKWLHSAMMRKELYLRHIGRVIKAASGGGD